MERKQRVKWSQLSQAGLHPIKKVMEITGLSEFVLRSWELRYKTVSPKRSPSGRRLYSDTDIQKLLMVKSLVQLGQPIRSISLLGDNELTDIVESNYHLSNELYDSELRYKSLSDVQDKIESSHASIIQGLQLYDIIPLVTFLEKVTCGDQVDYQILKLLFPLVRKIGSQVASNTLSVAQEHLATQAIEAILLRILMSPKNNQDKKLAQPKLKTKAKRSEEICYFFTPENEDHTLGLIAAAILAKHSGMKVHYFGRNLPFRYFNEAYTAERPSHIVVSARIFPKHYLEELKRVCVNDEVKIFLGGVHLFTDSEELKWTINKCEFKVLQCIEEWISFLKLKSV